MAKLVDQLRQLRIDLTELINRDPEQEVTGPALGLIDAVIAEARSALPDESTLGRSVVEIISVEAIEGGEPLRAADALVVVGQLLAVLETRQDGDYVSADRRLYERFVEFWPSHSSLNTLLRDHDFGGTFKWEPLDPLETFCNEWNNAERTFHDPAIDAARMALLESADRFRLDLASHSGPEDHGDWYAVVPVRHRDTFRVVDTDVPWAEIVDALNAAATEVYRLHQSLITVARQRLAL